MPRMSRRARRAQQRAKHRRCGAFAFAFGSLVGPALRARADVAPPPGSAPPTAPNNVIFNPQRAPIIVVRIGVHRLVLVPRPSGSATTLSAAAIESRANSSSFSSIIASSVPGAAASSSGELHIRGSHGQYTYFLDGAPLPSSVSGSFSDLIDPKNIQTLRVLTGGFPASYGGQIAAIFDVTAKGGVEKHPAGFGQQIAKGYNTYQTTVQAGSRFPTSWFMSALHSSTDRRLDPVTQEPLHDAGSSATLFSKLNFETGHDSRLVFDAARTDSRFQIPNEADRQAVGQDDVQRENGTFANLIWRRDHTADNLSVALYSHQSRLRFDGSPADLTPSAGAADASGLISTAEDRTANYVGLRTDYAVDTGSRHRISLGEDISAVSGRENFRIVSGNGDAPVSDVHSLSGGDRAAWVQDDWTPGRVRVNYGLRYDIHKAERESSQLSPRLNLTYTAGSRDAFHAYYNRLFQPAAIEDVRRLSGSTAVGSAVVTPIRPERNNFYEVGWQHAQGGITASVSGYYKTGKDVIDDSVLGDTQITVPFNVTKGYVRGLEFAVAGPLSRTVSFYANYARAWARTAGTISGGLLPTDPPTGYFPADHDQTHTASVGLAYEKRGVTLSADGEYGSGFPYDDNGQFARVAPHFIVNLAAGLGIGRGQVAFTVDNVANHPYIIKQAGAFTNRQWGQSRTFGVKWTQNF